MDAVIEEFRSLIELGQARIIYSLLEESVTGVQSRRVHIVHIVISTGLPVPCLMLP